MAIDFNRRKKRQKRVSFRIEVLLTSGTDGKNVEIRTVYYSRVIRKSFIHLPIPKEGPYIKFSSVLYYRNENRDP